VIRVSSASREALSLKEDPVFIGRGFSKLLQQSGLAYSSFAHDGDRLTSACLGRFESVKQDLKLSFSSDEAGKATYSPPLLAGLVLRNSHSATFGAARSERISLGSSPTRGSITAQRCRWLPDTFATKRSDPSPTVVVCTMARIPAFVARTEKVTDRNVSEERAGRPRANAFRKRRVSCPPKSQCGFFLNPSQFRCLFNQFVVNVQRSSHLTAPLI
jgi:hypothetical protein